ncbi:TonB-dependent receptor [bacterium]|nr:TonB-dependent receptor [bacterium]
MFGFAGIFNTDIIDYVNFSSGGFSSQYGNRLSSVIDLRAKSEAPDKFSGSGSLSLLSTRLTLDGQLDKHWYYMVSGRRTYLDHATQFGKFMGWIPETIPYRFQDGMAKVIYQANAEHQFGFSAFGSSDNFQDKDKSTLYATNFVDYSTIKLPYSLNTKRKFQWDNAVFNGHWEFKNENGFLSRLTVFQSRATNDLGINVYYTPNKDASDSIRHVVDSLNAIPDPNPFAIDNQVLDRTVRWDMEYELHNDHKLLIGGEFNRIQLSYYWDNLFVEANAGDNYQVFFDAAPDSFTYRRLVYNYAAYLEDIWSLNDQWTVKPGIRIESFGHSKSSIVVSPRVAIRYDLNERLAFKAATGIYYQSLFNSREKGYVGFLEIPFSTSGMKLQKSIHYILGAEYFLNRDSKFTGDIYYKHASNLSRNRRATSNTPVFIKGESDAYGMELTWKRLGKKFSYEINYVLAYVTRTFENLTYNTNYDQRHALSFIGNYLLPAHWSFDFRWVFTSGRAYRPASFSAPYYYFNPSEGQLYGGDYNNDARTIEFDNLNFYGRYPVYHRLDISFVKTIEFKKWTLKPYINIINTYYKSNPLYYQDQGTDKAIISNKPDPQYVQIRKRAPIGIPIVPSFGAHFEF